MADLVKEDKVGYVEHRRVNRPRLIRIAPGPPLTAVQTEYSLF